MAAQLDTNTIVADVLVVGGGIAGLTAAIETAEAGLEVVLIEKAAYLGGRVAGFHKYFPKLCPPTCGLEINFQRIRKNNSIAVFTMAELKSLSGSAGAFDATVRISPRYIGRDCTGCGECERVCQVEIPDDFNHKLSRHKAAHLPHAAAFPMRYAITRSACPLECHACADVCPPLAISLGQQPETKIIHTAAIVIATGWAPYDAGKLDTLGFGKYPNVVTNVMLERMASPTGPTGGRILRPSDGKPPRSVAFLQCAGSRDENHLPYCSSVCCSASLKHVRYIRELCPETQISIFYIDLRTPGILEDFAQAVREMPGVELIKGKAGLVEQDGATSNLFVTAEDVLRSRKRKREFELVVLATGMKPQTDGLPGAISRDEFGFVRDQRGIYAAGCAERPGDVAAIVRESTGAALRAFKVAVQTRAHG